MFKKMTAAILAISLITAMWTVPAEASSFSDVPFYNVDFNSGSFDDVAGGVKGEEAYSGDVQQAEFVQDNTLGRKVLRFHGQSALFYPEFDYSKIRSNFTMEAYVKVSAEQTEWGYIAGTYWKTDLRAGVCIAFGGLSEPGSSILENISSGLPWRYSVTMGNGSTCDTMYSWDSKRANNLWTHLVYVHNGVTEYFYEDGNLVTSRKVWLQSIPSIANDSDKAFRIGGYNRLSEHGTIMDCAYVRVYDTAANRQDVAQLYANRLNPLELVSKPSKLTYSVGEELDLTGMQLAVQVDGAKIPVAVEDCTVTGFDSSKVGEQEIIVVYETEDTIYSTVFTVRVVSVTSITLATKPAKLSYTYGETLDTTGLSILVHYSDGTEDFVSEGLHVTGYSAKTVGLQKLRVSYQDRTTSFSIKVNPVEIAYVSSIGLAVKPAKLIYAYGEALDTTGLSVLVHYSDGTVGYVSTYLNVTGYDAEVPGFQRLKITYQGRTSSYSVRVLGS